MVGLQQLDNVERPLKISNEYEYIFYANWNPENDLLAARERIKSSKKNLENCEPNLIERCGFIQPERLDNLSPKKD